MKQETRVKLIVGSSIAETLCENEAIDLRDGIRDLRKDSSAKIPLIHITDGIEIEKDNYEIRIDNKTVLAKKASENNKENLIKSILKDIEQSCINL